jgi:hypothetical protein
MDPNLLLLTYNVTYFDNMGWPDTLATRQWDSRHKTYVKNWGRNNLFTPQIIADGIADGTGAGDNEVTSIVSQARQARKQTPWHIIVDTNAADGELRIDSDNSIGEVDAHDILIIQYDDKPEEVKIKKGPNKGKKMLHRNIVKAIVKVGEWNGGNKTLDLKELASQGAKSGLQGVAVVQAPLGGPIRAAQWWA